MIGPFDVDPDSIERLAEAFPYTVNDLLEAEVGRAGMFGYQLDINRKIYTADGGVDAAIWTAAETEWLPAGHSAWQFKAGDLPPGKCREELRDAEWAKELVGAGATYVLVLGKPLTSRKRTARYSALVTEAESLGMKGASVRVYDGHQLARWASTLPGFALDRRLGGPGPSVLDFDRWSASEEHAGHWVTCASRADMEDSVRRLAAGSLKAYRIEGGSGLGKTRLVMEVLRDSSARRLVVYAPRAEQLLPETLSFLTRPGRTSVLIVDNCDRSHHQSILEQVDTDGTRLLTIGSHPVDKLVQTPLHLLPPAASDEIDSILRKNVPTLWPEAARVVHEHSLGNVRTALMMAKRLVETGEEDAAELLRHNDFRELITSLLPEHIDFFSAAVLALLERVGWDRERSYQLEVLSQFADISTDDLRSTIRRLEAAELATRHGRYISVTPQPVAVFLAASAWEQLGTKIFDSLVPNCDAEMLEALFQRGAELGRFEPVRSVLLRLLSTDGPYGSLAGLEVNNASFLVHIAIVLPNETAQHLSELIEAASVDQLRQQTSGRRDLVRALEKLAWHTYTFETAADCLLKLAVAENETWANNSTGQWTSLFSARLPTTAATPSQRLAYLNRKAEDGDARVRRLLAAAVSEAVRPFESAMVSGELQAGAIVEPRGSVQRGEEAVVYWDTLVQILGRLREDVDPEVCRISTDGILASIPSFIDAPRIGESISNLVASFTGDDLRKARRSTTQLIQMGEPAESGRLRLLLERLPEPTPLEQLREKAELSPWEWHDKDVAVEFTPLLELAQAQGEIDVVVEWLATEPIASAWQIGHALGSLSGGSAYMATLVKTAALNAPALAGFLAARQHEDPATFDRFLDVDQGRTLPASLRLYLTTAGPISGAALKRAVALTSQVPVVDGASRLLAVQEHLDLAVVRGLLSDWLGRTSSADDYAAVIDWLQMLAHRRQGLPSELHEISVSLLVRRREFPNLGHQRWGWSRLAQEVAATFPLDVGTVVLDLIADGAVTVFEGSSYESGALGAAAAAAPNEILELVMSRLEAGDWRLMMALRGWFSGFVPLDVVDRWIGDSVGRARTAASIARVGAEEPDPLAVLLLSRFPDDTEVESALAAEYVSGGWAGPWSEHLEGQINQLGAWRSDEALPLPVRRWARRMIEDLERRRVAALEREAEEYR